MAKKESFSCDGCQVDLVGGKKVTIQMDTGGDSGFLAHAITHSCRNPECVKKASEVALNALLKDEAGTVHHEIATVSRKV